MPTLHKVEWIVPNHGHIFLPSPEYTRPTHRSLTFLVQGRQSRETIRKTGPRYFCSTAQCFRIDSKIECAILMAKVSLGSS